jgi:predicted NUDIX family NTP pyrophosphohydrolase
MKQSAGLLLFRTINQQLEIFLVHPGGPFYAKKDAGFWTIPKGELEDQEEPLNAAIRDFEEEIGFKPSGSFIELGTITQKGGKKVFCWALEANVDLENIKSNLFEIEWPPRSGKMKAFPEIDRAAWFGYQEAEKKINERQVSFLAEVKAKLRF